ncbi:MAG: (2Fe-2S)-binding protein [Paralcaligenes sp.]
MFMCICNAITERDVQAAVADGADSLSDLQAQLGIATSCGCCAETAAQYLSGGRYGSPSHTEHGLGVRAMAGSAANDAGAATTLIETVARRA